MLRKRYQSIHGIVHVSKTPGLRTITIYRKVCPGQGLPHEIGNDHTVTPGLAGANDIEHARNHSGHPLFFSISDRQNFVNQLGAGITPPSFVGWAEDKVITFSKR